MEHLLHKVYSSNIAQKTNDDTLSKNQQITIKSNLTYHCFKSILLESGYQKPEQHNMKKPCISIWAL